MDLSRRLCRRRLQGRYIFRQKTNRALATFREEIIHELLQLSIRTPGPCSGPLRYLDLLRRPSGISISARPSRRMRPSSSSSSSRLADR